MRLLDINLKPDRRTLVQFGLAALVAFGVLGGLVFWKKSVLGIPLGGATAGVALVLWGIGLLSGVLSLVAPQGNRFLYVALVRVSYPIGFVLSYVLMAVIFYVILTPAGIVFRLIGRDPLNRRFDPRAETYWVPHRDPEEVERYFRQY